MRNWTKIWALDLSERQIERLIRLVEDMLDVSRITTGRLALNCETIDLPVLVKEVSERYRSEFVKARSTLELNAVVPSLVGQRWWANGIVCVSSNSSST